MKLVILTTDTLHHTWFVQKLDERHGISAIFLEQEKVEAPFLTGHPFEAKRDEYEAETLLKGGQASMKEITDVIMARRMNDREAVGQLRDLKPDLILVFGTAKLSKEVIGVCPGRIWNLHGGDPERYRGLDSHLWGIHRGEFDSIVTTLHHVSEGLDEGDLISRKPVPLKKGMKLHELRARNTEVCLELTLEALGQFLEKGGVASEKQKKKGEYFSFMPSTLKEACRIRFEEYTAKEI